MGTTPTPSTVERQAPTALRALVQHIHTHGLGTPLTITAPSTASPYFSVSVPSTVAEAWVESGLTVTTCEARVLGGGRISGRLYEQVSLDGILAPHGIRVRLTYAHALEESPTRHLAAVGDGGAA